MHRDIQVATWATGGYLTNVRSITHWHQADEVRKVAPERGSVLEIGPGCGHTTWLLKYFGLSVTTLDYDPAANPDMVGDVTHLEAIPDRHFDCALAAEVLEHLPFSEFGTALLELRRVSRGHVIVTLPAPLVGVAVALNLPKVKPFNLTVGLPYWRTHRFDGQHHWELGKRGYSKRRVLAEFARAGLTVKRHFRPTLSLNAYFFVAAVN